MPDGLNGYYYEFFTRQFGHDIERYKKEIAPILQLMVASPTIMTLSFVQYVLGVESEREFYDTISKLEHVTRYVREVSIDRMRGESVPRPDKITFFHNSIENWLINHAVSGSYYVSKENGTRIIAEKFSQWLIDASGEDDYYWSTYAFGLQVLGEAKKTMSNNSNRERLGALMNAMRHYGALGGFTKEFNKGRQSAVAYCRSLLSEKKENEFLSFILEIFECVKDQFMEIDGSEFVPTKMFNATRDAGTIGAILKFLFEKEIPCSEETFAIVLRVLRVLVYYDSCLCDPFDHLPSQVFEDLQDFSAIEMSKLADELGAKLTKGEFEEEFFNKTTALYYEALAKRYPDKYPNNIKYSMREIYYPIGSCVIRACN